MDRTVDDHEKEKNSIGTVQEGGGEGGNGCSECSSVHEQNNLVPGNTTHERCASLQRLLPSLERSVLHGRRLRKRHIIWQVGPHIQRQGQVQRTGTGGPHQARNCPTHRGGKGTRGKSAGKGWKDWSMYRQSSGRRRRPDDKRRSSFSHCSWTPMLYQFQPGWQTRPGQWGHDVHRWCGPSSKY